MKKVAAILIVMLLTGATPALAQKSERIGPPTPDTCFWTDREFKDLPEQGPTSAAGIVLWSHGQVGNGRPGWRSGAPPAIRVFAEKGWDVLLVQRNERCEGTWAQKGRDYVNNLVAEVTRAKQRGYRHVIVAGQSYGAGTALGAGGKSNDIDGVIAFALSHGRGSCRDPKTFSPSMIPLHAGYIKQGIEEARSPRILISMGKDDQCVGYSFTPLIESGLAARPVAYIHLDEAMSFAGHSAALSRKFAAAYGDCIYTFFTRDAPPRGRTMCEEKS
jgi:dienelactone hydrolase